MQLVLSNNRVIAHGENFLSMGGVVINTETGATYNNATIAECKGCPSDINEVGYEYHAGVFVPCAPYGKGNNNGYIMEVCGECATPRNSEIPIIDVKWSKIGSAAFSVENILSAYTESYTIPVSESVLNEYTMLRYRIKAGSYLIVGKMFITTKETTPSPYKEDILSVGTKNICELIIPYSTSGNTYGYNTRIFFENDFIAPFNLVNYGLWSADVSERVRTSEKRENNYIFDLSAGAERLSSQWYTPEGNIINDPTTIFLTIPHTSSSQLNLPSEANIIIELEGRR